MDSKIENNEVLVECRSCGEEVNIEDMYQGKCDACEDRQMVQGIR